MGISGSEDSEEYRLAGIREQHKDYEDGYDQINGLKLLLGGDYENELFKIKQKFREKFGDFTKKILEDKTKTSTFAKSIVIFLFLLFDYLSESVVADYLCIGAVRSVCNIGLDVIMSQNGQNNKGGICNLLTSQLQLAALCGFETSKFDVIESVISQEMDFTALKTNNRLVFDSMWDRIFWGKYNIDDRIQDLLDRTLTLGMFGRALDIL